MKRWILLGWLMIGVANGQSALPEITLIAEHHFDDQGRLVVTGRTNLPDGTNMSASAYSQRLRYHASGDCAVKEGAFRCPVTGQLPRFPAGQYELMTGSKSERDQPPNIGKLFGERGANLRGPAIVTTSWNISFARVTELVQVGTEEDARLAEQALDTKVRVLYGQIINLLRTGVEMQPLRDDDSIEAAGRCGDEMRRNQAKARELVAKARRYPTGGFGGLIGGAVHLELCVSCSRTGALDACGWAVESFGHFENSFAEWLALVGR